MMYTVGIIGTGFGSKVHLPGFQNHPDFEVEIIAGRDPDKTQNIASDVGIDGTTNWREITTGDVDVVAVTTPPFLHYEMAKAVLESGKHLLLEKPTTQHHHQAKELASLALNQGLVGMMSHEFRWIPERNYLADLIQSGKIGTLRELHYMNYYSFGASPDLPQFGWLWDSRFEGGMLGAIGSHLVDQIRHTTDKEFASVSGYLATRVQNRANSKGGYSRVTADDGFGMNFELDGGIQGDLIVSTTMAPAPPTQFILGGDKGTLNLKGDELYFAEPEGEFEILPVPENFQIDKSLEEQDRRLPPFMKLLDQFSAALGEGNATSPSLTDGWRNQQVIDAVRESHRLGSRISIAR